MKAFIAWLKSLFEAPTTDKVLAEYKASIVAESKTAYLEPLAIVSVMSGIPKLGDKSNDVKILQAALKRKGFDPGSSDGEFGSKTKAAVSKAQKAAGLSGSGVIAERTLDFLGLKIEEKKQEQAPVGHAVNPAYLDAKKWDGKKETDKAFSDRISKVWAKVGLPGYKTISGSSYAWCALFIAFTSINAGIGYVSKRGASAKAQDTYGVAIEWRVNGIPRGAVVRVNSSSKCDSGSGNHVTFADGDCTLEDIKRGTFPGYGGNQANQVKRSTYKIANICAVRWPSEIPKPGKITKSFNCRSEEASDESTR